ncbi:MAG: PhaM family polyhydroxyalkanoate granule multifunctional regulatory protein [Burkholderiales bacterium]
MQKPSVPHSPGMDAMTDTLDFVKNLWGGMNMPGMNIPGIVMPTLSVDEINKQIADLKAVESWLTLNMNMLRGTIQALEVQSATISALHSMSEALSAAVRPAAAPEAAAAPRESAYSFSKEAGKPAEMSAEAPQAEQKPESKPSPKPQTTAPGEPAAQLANPAIWWNMLQDQFKQAVNTAMASEKPEKVAKTATQSSAKSASAAKPAVGKEAGAKKTPTPRQRKTPKSA